MIAGQIYFRDFDHAHPVTIKVTFSLLKYESAFLSWQYNKVRS